MKFVSPLLDMFLPEKWRTRISHVSAILKGKPYGFLIDPSYSEDGLITFHLSEFMNEPKFARAMLPVRQPGLYERTRPIFDGEPMWPVGLVIGHATLTGTMSSAA